MIVDSQKEKRRNRSGFIKNWFQQNEFLALLLALLAFLFLPSFIMDEKVKDLMIYTLLVVVLAVGVFELAGNQKRFLAGIILAFTAFLLNSLNFSSNENLVFFTANVKHSGIFYIINFFYHVPNDNSSQDQFEHCLLRRQRLYFIRIDWRFNVSNGPSYL